MFTKDDRFYRMVVLILSCSSNFHPTYGSSYKVRDSTEDLSENNSDFSKSFGNTPFIFPDYFSKEEKGFPGFSDEFASSESFPVTRNGSRATPDSYSSVYDGSKSWESTGDEERSAKKPILTLFDDWSPEEDERSNKPQGGNYGNAGNYDDGLPKNVSPKTRPAFNPPPKIRPGPPYSTPFKQPQRQKQPNHFRAPFKSNQKPPLNNHYKTQPTQPSFVPSKNSNSYSPYTNEDSFGPVSFSPTVRSPNKAPTLSSYRPNSRPSFSPGDSRFSPSLGETRPSFASSGDSRGSFSPEDSRFSPSFGETRPSFASSGDSRGSFSPGDSRFSPSLGERPSFSPSLGKSKPSFAPSGDSSSFSPGDSRFSPSLGERPFLPSLGESRPSFSPSSSSFSPSDSRFTPSFRSSAPKGFKEVSVHQHQFGVNHDYEPRVKIEDSISFRSKPEPIYVKPSNEPSHLDLKFKPSIPDPKNKIPIVPKPSDFLSAFTTLVPKKPKGCVKTKKSKGQVKWMNCFLCTDDKTGKQFERCSEEKKNERVKRNIERGKRQYEYNDDEEHYYGPDHHEYRFGPEHFVDDAPVEEPQTSSETPQETETCWKKKKGEMLCIVCENTANGGTYEQCAYGSDPKKNSYERSVSKVYGSPRLPNQERSVQKPIRKPIPRNRSKLTQARSAQPYIPKYRHPYKTQNYHQDVNKPKKVYNEGIPDPYNPVKYQHYPEQRKYSDIPSYDTFPDLPYNSSPTIPDYNEQYDEYEEYPEAEDGQGEFSVHQKVETPSESFGHRELANKAKNFSNNRTSCLKVIKNKMTCFQCVDEKGSKQEECMYVAGTEPSNKKMSYREVKEFNYQPSNSTEYPGRGKRKFKKNHRQNEKGEIIRQTRNTNKTQDETDLESEANNLKPDYDPVPTEPPDLSTEIQTDDEHSDETELTFDPHLGISLPRYMLEKSEHEAIFDEALASG